MSKQLTFSATISALTMALFALTMSVGEMTQAPSAYGAANAVPLSLSITAD
ncbi:MAG: hypothetical protein WAT93_05980 [Pontixanthobacter sp.]